jgi:hypothetical protein
MTDWFIRAFGDAVADARQKLIEEAWFGRKHAGSSPTHHHQPDDRGRDPQADFYGREHDLGRDR